MGNRQKIMDEIKQYEDMLTQVARTSLLRFTFATMPNFRPADFHRRYYDILSKFAHGLIKKLMVFMPPQHGKELKDSTLVPTPKGFVRHGDLKVGDYVFGRDGQPVRVKWVSPKVMSEYIVTFSDGQEIECHGNHEWVVYDRSYAKERTLETKYMASQKLFSGTNGKRGCHYRFQVDNVKCVEFEKRHTEIDPYTLGAWLGDGLYSSGLIHIGLDDTEIISKIGEIYSTHENSGSQSVRRFRIDGLSEQLKIVGVHLNKHIPQDYIFNSVECRKELIAGLIDTDGYVYPKNGRVTISNTNKRIIDDAALILRSLGQVATVTAFEPKTSSSGIDGKQTVYQLCFNPTTNFPTVVPRKKIKRTITNRRRTIVSIEPIENGEQGNCIEVEGGVYLVGDTFIPTHNSEGSTRRLPAFIEGINPECRIAVISYNSPKARKFNREIQRIIDTPEYRNIFPETTINGKNARDSIHQYVRTADEFEIVGHQGSVKTVGVCGPLTGDPVDVLIMDDLYKDAASAWSPTVRENIQDWYDTVAETRLHNDSQQLIVFTRWHEDDLAGVLIRQQGEYDEVENPDGWVIVTYKAIKEGEPTEYDPREEGEALWPERHSLHKLETIRKRNSHVFGSLYQQHPMPQEGLMYSSGFRTYSIIPNTRHRVVKAYCDTADTGSDYLCSIVYVETEIANYILDVLYTQKPMEYTEPKTAEQFTKHNVEHAIIESNNGGRSFARKVEEQCRIMGNLQTQFIWFTQTENKQARIFSHSAEVQNMTFFPVGWEHLWPEFYESIMSYLKSGKNPHDDAPDALTGTVEHRDMTSDENENALRNLIYE